MTFRWLKTPVGCSVSKSKHIIEVKVLEEIDQDVGRVQVSRAFTGMYNLSLLIANKYDLKYINIMDFVCFPIFWHFLGELTLKGILVLFSFCFTVNH